VTWPCGTRVGRENLSNGHSCFISGNCRPRSFHILGAEMQRLGAGSASHMETTTNIFLQYLSRGMRGNYEK